MGREYIRERYNFRTIEKQPGAAFLVIVNDWLCVLFLLAFDVMIFLYTVTYLRVKSSAVVMSTDYISSFRVHGL